ncbi:DUF4430 domain-containing protein [Candidatus Pacearchaeota archaeon]|nr:DUF4430 domain-containing protein [Candidatus Pacearchaeota archaeon]
MPNFKKLYSKFITVVVIFLVLIGVNSLVSRYMPLNKDKDQVEGTVKVQNDLTDEAEQDGLADPVELSEPSQTTEPVDPAMMFDAEASPAAVASITYESQADGQNAFELLKDVAKIDYKEYDFGVFVESINGVKGDDKHFWAFYLNGEQAKTGADQTILQKGDKVEWRYEEIK